MARRGFKHPCQEGSEASAQLKLVSSPFPHERSRTRTVWPLALPAPMLAPTMWTEGMGVPLKLLGLDLWEVKSCRGALPHVCEVRKELS